jgi:hypothetical protein
MTTEIESEIKAFKKGFTSILPIDLLENITVTELKMMIAGIPNIDSKKNIILYYYYSNIIYINYLNKYFYTVYIVNPNFSCIKLIKFHLQKK